MPPPPRPGPRPNGVRALAALLNLFLLACSLLLLLLTGLALVSPPKSDISPQQVSSYPQYVITLFLIGCFGCCLFFVAFLGITSLVFFNSFMLSLHVFAQAALIGAQFIAVAFTVTVRKRVLKKVEDTWYGKEVCSEGVRCVPIERFLNSEVTLLILFASFLIFQIILLAMSSYLAEKRSYEERYERLVQKAEDDDE